MHSKLRKKWKQQMLFFRKNLKFSVILNLKFGGWKIFSTAFLLTDTENIKVCFNFKQCETVCAPGGAFY